MIQDIIFAGSFTLIGVLVGALLTHFLSNVRGKKERLTDGIYRPLLGVIGEINETIRHGENPDLKSLEKTRHDGLYFVMDEKIRELTEDVCEELDDYASRREASIGSVNRTMVGVITKYAPKEELEKYRGAGYEMHYSAYVNNRYVGGVDLRESLLIDKPPTLVLMEKKPMVKDSDIRSTIGGYDV